MTLNAVQEFVRATLDGLPLPVDMPSTQQPLQAIVAPPTVGQPHGPVAYIRARHWDEKRLSGPPGLGTKQAIHQVSIVLRWQIAVGGLNGQQGIIFTALIDAVRKALDRMPKSISVIDPVTGERSTAGLFGDTQSGDLQGPWAVQDQRMQLWGAPLSTQVKEYFKA